MLPRTLLILIAATNVVRCVVLPNFTSQDDPFESHHYPSSPVKYEQNERGGDRCFEYLHTRLDKLRRRQLAGRSATIDLSGYALHQTLRNVPLDMYVTDIKVRAPSVSSWAHVNNCHLLPRGEINAQVTFNDLVVSGVVRLLEDGVGQIKAPPPFCSMVLRLRRAGLDLKAISAAAIKRISHNSRNQGLQVRTEANFIEPQFVSVHAHGCQLQQWAKENPITFDEENSEYFQRDSHEPNPLHIITLGEEPELDDSLTENLESRDLHKQRILNYRLQPLGEFITIKQQIQEQVNSAFQTHGPFSDKPFLGTSTTTRTTTNRATNVRKPIFVPSPQAIAQLTELDSKFQPVKEGPNKVYHGALSQNAASFMEHPGLYEIHSEMEDVFLRGTKALITKYLEKQLETPLKEALMTSIGYTVSYG